MAGGAHPHEMGNVEGLTEILNNHERRITENTTRITALEQAFAEHLEGHGTEPPPAEFERAEGFGSAAVGGSNLVMPTANDSLKAALATPDSLIRLHPGQHFQLGRAKIASNVTMIGGGNNHFESTMLHCQASSNVVLKNLWLDSVPNEASDLLRVNGGTDLWFDQLTFTDSGDEQMELYAYPTADEDVGDVTISRCRYRPDKFGLIIGEHRDYRGPEYVERTRVSIYASWFQAHNRNPLVGGAWVDMWDTYIGPNDDLDGGYSNWGVTLKYGGQVDARNVIFLQRAPPLTDSPSMRVAWDLGDRDRRNALRREGVAYLDNPHGWPTRMGIADDFGEISDYPNSYRRTVRGLTRQQIMAEAGAS